MSHIDNLIQSLESDTARRVAEKLRRLGDPERNPEPKEAKAARDKTINMLYLGKVLHDSVDLHLSGETTEEQLREAIEKLGIDTTWLRIQKGE